MNNNVQIENSFLRHAARLIAHPNTTLDKLLVKMARRATGSGRLLCSPVPWGEQAAAQGLQRLVLERFYDPAVGRLYGVDRRAKEQFVQQCRANIVQIPSATSWPLHVVLAQQILSVPPEVKGDVIECGCYKGSSTASLSLACKLAGRRLWVCDSFAGLPEDESSRVHDYPHLKVYGHYEKGMYAGRLEEVRDNVSRLGAVSACQFVRGFFCDSLKSLAGPFVLAFLDVDLVSSMKDCIQHIWPLLADGSFVFTDDSLDMEVMRVWFEDGWWQQTLGERSPGYVGSGCGLPLAPDSSSLGYARKLARPDKCYQRVPWLRYPGSEAEVEQEGNPIRTRSVHTP